MPTLVWQALLMVFEEGQSLNDRFLNARSCYAAMYPNRRRPGKTYQGFIKAQSSISPAMLEMIKAQFRDQHRRVAGRYQQRFGWEAFACDGSRVEVPRTAKNQEAFGCAGKNKTGPQLSLTTLYHMGTGLPWDWQIGAGGEAERTHLRAMLSTLPEKALIVADAGFTGYDLAREIMDSGRSFLIRVGSNVNLLTKLMDVQVKQEGETVWLWPQDKRELAPLKLRLIYTPPSSSFVEGMYLLTNVFDHQTMPYETAYQLYRMRWGVELFYRGLKRTLDQHKLRSDAPQQALWELQWAMMAYLLLGFMTVDAIVQQGHDPLSMSVATALRTVRQAMREPQRRWRRRGDLRVLLGNARKDTYQRTGSKRSRDWPYKKKDPSPGAPKIREATHEESALAKRVCIAA